jgi:maltose O-acetyltransferase
MKASSPRVRSMQKRRHVNRLWSLQVNTLAATPFLTGTMREWFYRRGGIDPNGTQLRTGLWFYSAEVSFGPGGMVNSGCYFESREPITIGDRCFLGPEVLILTSTHEMGDSYQRAGAYAGKPVNIGDGCWLGARVTVLPGVTIAPGCVIAAGSVVTRDTTPDGLYAGVPAVRKSDLSAGDIPIASTS